MNLPQIIGRLGACHRCPFGTEVVGGRLICGQSKLEANAIDESAKCPKGLWPEHVYIRGISDAKTSLWEKALSLGKAVTSGGVDDATFDQRMASCDSCPKLTRKGAKKYCGACGCGRWALSELDVKLRFKALPCPLGRPGFAAPT